MDQFTLPRLRATVLPPIGRRRSFTCPGVVLRAFVTLVCALLALVAILRGPASRAPVAGAAAVATQAPPSRS